MFIILQCLIDYRPQLLQSHTTHKVNLFSSIFKALKPIFASVFVLQ